MESNDFVLCINFKYHSNLIALYEIMKERKAERIIILFVFGFRFPCTDKLYFYTQLKKVYDDGFSFF